MQLNNYLAYPHVPETNFALARWYEEQGHDSPAVSFYIRVAEFAEEIGFEDNSDLLILAYEALLRAHFCIDRQKTRELTAKSLLQRAISLVPDRPEAYYLLSRFEQKRMNWVEAYMLSCIGFELEAPEVSLSTNVGYTGPQSFLLPRAISAYHWGRGTEARKILQELVTNYRPSMPFEERKIVAQLLSKWGVGDASVADVPYIASRDRGQIKYEFDGIDNIERNYSQAYQDMFVLTVLNGKEGGTYLEIGSEEPHYKSNTFLLEDKFNWKGVSVEIDQAEVERFASHRKNPVLCADATKVDYEGLIGKVGLPKDIDYLQIDTEPPSTTFNVLLSIPFETYRFGVITYEHDYAVDFSKVYRERSRKYLQSMGYVLVVPDVGPTDWYSFEDWWVHPELVDVERLHSLGMIISPESTKTSGANDVKLYFLV